MILEELQKIKNELAQIEQGLSSFDMLRERLKKDFNLDGLKEKLQSIPAEIADIQQKAQGIRKQIPDIETQMKEIEAKIIYEITMKIATDPEKMSESGVRFSQQDVAKLTKNGKPKSLYPNAEARMAELINRLKINKEYIRLKNERVDLESESTSFDIEIDKLRNTFRANLAIKDLIVAEMNLYRG